MVFVFGWGPRGRRPRLGPGYRGGYGYGPPPPGLGYRRGYGGGGGSCLRDLLFLDAGCCLAQSLGCGNGLFLVAPAALRHVHRQPAGGGRGAAGRLIGAIRVYQREISPKRAPVCRFEPSCSSYAVEALARHGAARGAWLAVRRLVRCRPGAAGGADPVPAT